VAAGAIDGFLERLSRGMAAEAHADRTDAELVRRLRAGPDPAGFAAVVRRHGPMVYRVCRRVLRHEADAEDAFQATFLVLARNLRSVRRPTSLAAWIHGVALRTALRARANAAARRRAERQVPPPGSCPPDDLTWGELRCALDEEPARLPERWRLPLVLCHLEGRTQDEACRQLGWPRITLRRRLDEARAALGRRLTRRGFGPAAIAATLVADCLTAGAAPARLIDRTSSLITAAGRAATPARVSHLAQAVRTSMTAPIRFQVSAAVLAAGLVVTGGWLSVGGPPDKAAAQDRTPTVVPPPPAEAPPEAVKPAPVDFAGGWRLARPAGFEHDIKLTALPGGRYRFESKGLVFNGVYERKDGKLVMAEPADNRTYNHYVQAVQQFGGWLTEQRRLSTNPFRGLTTLNPRLDVRRKHRALSPDEFTRLIESARNSGETIQSFTGEERARIYLLSYLTGLRRSELGSLNPSNFNLAAEPETVTIPATISEHRRTDVLPLHPALVPLIKDWIRGLAPNQVLFPRLATRRTWLMVKKDLERAGLPYVTPEGVADFHAAGRHSYITQLFRSGASVAHVLELARHGELRTTMGYTPLGLDDRAKALAALPNPWQHIGSDPGPTEGQHPSSTVIERHEKDAAGGTANP
jgi:RNA polymerase sigma factor (sigma-70 family)